MQNIQKIRIGTRGSKLALAQAHMVQKLLENGNENLQTQIVKIKTTGDKIIEKNLNEIGGKGLFIKEIEEKLLDGSIDIAVHSMKDMPAFIPGELEIPCILPREDPRDALISTKASKLSDLPKGAIIGTSSPRRASQALNLRPDVKIVPFRGNIHTRLEKLKENTVDATFLAVAGLKRASITDNIITPIEVNEMLPAVAQGAIGIEISKGKHAIKDLLSPLNDNNTYICIQAERAFLEEFEGSCQTPIAALANIEGKQISIDFMIASMDGQKILRTSREGKLEDAQNLGKDAAAQLANNAGENFFK